MRDGHPKIAIREKPEHIEVAEIPTSSSIKTMMEDVDWIVETVRKTTDTDKPIIVRKTLREAYKINEKNQGGTNHLIPCEVVSSEENDQHTAVKLKNKRLYNEIMMKQQEGAAPMKPAVFLEEDAYKELLQHPKVRV